MAYPKLVVADAHVHERRGRNRVKEAETLIKKLRVIGVKNKCDELLFLGDFLDRNTPISVNLLLKFGSLFKAFRRVRFLLGNHDTPIRGKGSTLLDIFQLAGAEIISEPMEEGTSLYLPYYADVDYKAYRGRNNAFRFVFAHKDVPELNHYHDEDWALPMDEFPRAGVIMNGHIHGNAEMPNEDGKRVFIQVGAPYPNTWGDDYAKNQFVYLAFQDGSYKRIPLRITADADAEDAGNFVFTRERAEEQEKPDMAAVTIEDIRADQIDISEALKLVDADERIKRMTQGVVRNVGTAKITGAKL